MGHGPRRARATLRADAPTRHQRDRSAPAHEPRPLSAAGGRPGRDPGSRVGVLDRGVRPGPRRSRPEAGPRAPAREGRLRLRRRDRRQQQRGGGPARPGGPRAGPGGPRVPRRARRDRRVVQDPRDPRSLGRAPSGSRNDQPHDGRRLSQGLLAGGRAPAFGPSVELRDPRLHAAPGPGGARRSRARSRRAVAPRPGHGLRGGAGGVRRAGRAHGRRVPRRGRGPRDVLGRQALLGPAGRIPLRPRGARQARGRASGGPRRASRQAGARGARRDARRLEDGRLADVPGVPRGGRDAVRARGARPPTRARRLDRAARRRRRAVARGLRRRHQPGEALRIPGARAPASRDLGGRPRRGAARRDTSDRRAARGRHGAAGPALDRAGRRCRGRGGAAVAPRDPGRALRRGCDNRFDDSTNPRSGSTRSGLAAFPSPPCSPSSSCAGRPARRNPDRRSPS